MQEENHSKDPQQEAAIALFEQGEIAQARDLLINLCEENRRGFANNQLYLMAGEGSAHAG